MAVFVSAIVSMIIGSVWYSPVFFGAQWMRLMGFTPERISQMKERGMAITYASNFVFDMIRAYVFSSLILVLSLSRMSKILGLGVLVWLGFMTPILVGGVLWENKSHKLLVINAGYWLVSMIFMAMVLGLWR